MSAGPGSCEFLGRMETACRGSCVNLVLPLAVSVSYQVHSFTLSFLRSAYMYEFGCTRSELWRVRSFSRGVQTLSCGLWNQFPDQGSDPGPLHWACRILATGPSGMSCFNWFLLFHPELVRRTSPAIQCYQESMCPGFSLLQSAWLNYPLRKDPHGSPWKECCPVGFHRGLTRTHGWKSEGRIFTWVHKLGALTLGQAFLNN